MRAGTVTAAAEQDRITAENDRRAALKAAEQHVAEQTWIAGENDRRAARQTAIDEPIPTPRVRSDWSEWSAEQERQRLAANVAEAQAAAEQPIYPRELAERIASEYAKVSFPDWRLLKIESRGLVQRLIRDQPEMRQPETKRRGELVTLIRGHLPPHIRALLSDLETIYGLIVTAQESAAFLVGHAMGRQYERMYFDTNRGVVRTRRRSPARLHDGTEVR
jgi:hypothetical protein